MPLDLSRVQGVFQLVVEQADPAARQRVLDEQCAGNPQLRARVELLLRAHDQPRELPAAAPAVTSVPRMIQHAGMVVAGRYKLLELLGEGGMGAVWVADQSEPIRRRVALKLIKPGMDSKQVLSRFEAERQALALMDHPNIAKVYDGGMTEEGRPYFAMEYVKGVPITDYCDAAKLSITERIKLVVPVCQAVQHAHQKGVIHRDLKPSNILVCLYDGLPVPKVIDFGLAKATSQPLTEHTLYTAHGLMVGTPMYMSPEQAEFNNLDVDTRTDIYSLGVILYELLTGTPPLEKQRFKDAAFAEILRIIKEDEPPRPSTKVSASATLPTLAAQRSIDPTQLSRQVRGELDWIVMKSLEKERSRRYETANGLARDLERFLKDEPVEACPPSLGYRFSKALRRNKQWFSAAAAVLLVMFTLTGAVGWVIRANWNQQAIVEQQATNFLKNAGRAADRGDLQGVENSLAQAEGVLATIIPSAEMAADVDSWKSDLELVQRLEGVDRQLAELIFDEEAQQHEWATAYSRVFQSCGFDRDDREKAIKWLHASPLRRSLSTAVDVWAMHSNEAERDRLLDIIREADTRPWRNRLRDALVRDDLSALRQLASDNDRRDQPVRAILLLQRALARHGDRDPAIDLLHEAQQTHPQDYWVNYWLGHLLMDEANADQAIVAARAAVAAIPQSAAARNLLGVVYCLEAQHSQAEEQFQRAIDLQPGFPLAHVNMAYALAEQKKLSEALQACEKALQLRPESAHFHMQKGRLLRADGETREAAECMREALRLAPDDWIVNENFLSLFQVRFYAIDFMRECRSEIKKPDADPRWRRWLGDALLLLDESELLEECTTVYADYLKLRPNDLLAQAGLVTALLRQGRVAQAEKVCEEMHKASPDQVLTDICWGAVLYSQERNAEAEVAFQQALRRDPHFLTTEMFLANARARQNKPPETRPGLQRLAPTVPTSVLASYLTQMGTPALDSIPNYRSSQWSWVTLPPRLRFTTSREVTSAGTSRAALLAQAKANASRNPKSASAQADYGWRLYDDSQFAAAMAQAVLARDLDRQYVDAYLLMGYIRRQLKEYEAAQRDLEHALKLSPDNRTAHYGLVMVYEHQGLREQADEVARRALEIDPKYVKSHNQLARLLVRRGNLIEAAEEYRIELEQDQARPWSHNDLGLVLQRLGKLDESQQHFAKARELDPKLTHTKLALDYAAGGYFWFAVEHFLADFQENPRSDSSAMRAAMLQLLQGDRAGYESTCQKMLERFDNAKESVAARRTLHACLISQQPVGTAEQLARLTANAVDVGYPERAARELGLAAYRAGRWDETLRQCRASRAANAADQNHAAIAAQNFILEAAAYHRLGKPAEARGAYYEAARQMRKKSPYAPDYPGSSWVDWVIYELIRREVGGLLQIADEPVDRQASNRAFRAVCQGDWNQAAEEFKAMCRDPRTDSMHWMRLPAVSIMCGDDAAYREHADEMRSRFLVSETWQDQERVAKTGIMLPEALDPATLPIVAFTKALEQRTVTEVHIPFGYASWAIAAYRMGDCEQALVAAEKVLNDSRSNELPRCQSLLVAALASRKLGRTEPAREYAQRARKMLGTAQLPTLPDGSLDIAKLAQTGNNWWDAIYIEVLRREAAELLEAK